MWLQGQSKTNPNYRLVIQKYVILSKFFNVNVLSQNLNHSIGLSFEIWTELGFSNLKYGQWFIPILTRSSEAEKGPIYFEYPSLTFGDE